jgi:hypothetical protein
MEGSTPAASTKSSGVDSAPARSVLVRLNIVEAKTNCFANFIARSKLALHPIVVRPWLRWYSVDRFLFFSDDPTFVSLMVPCSLFGFRIIVVFI